MINALLVLIIILIMIHLIYNFYLLISKVFERFNTYEDKVYVESVLRGIEAQKLQPLISLLLEEDAWYKDFMRKNITVMDPLLVGVPSSMMMRIRGTRVQCGDITAGFIVSKRVEGGDCIVNIDLTRLNRPDLIFFIDSITPGMARTLGSYNSLDAQRDRVAQIPQEGLQWVRKDKATWTIPENGLVLSSNTQVVDGMEPIFLFDGRVPSYPMRSQWRTYGENPVLTLTFPRATVISHFVLRMTKYDVPDVVPTSWRLEGSNDNRSWDLINQYTYHAWRPNMFLRFEAMSGKSYQHVRFVFQHSGELRIGRICLFGF